MQSTIDFYQHLKCFRLHYICSAYFPPVTMVMLVVQYSGVNKSGLIREQTTVDQDTTRDNIINKNCCGSTPDISVLHMSV